MSTRHPHTVADNLTDTCVLKQIFDTHAEETISDEQAERVLGPIREMIREGKFDKPKPTPWTQMSKRVATIAAVAAIAAAGTFAIYLGQGEEPNDLFVEIPHTQIPLADALSFKDNGLSLIVDGSYRVVAYFPASGTGVQSIEVGILVVTDGFVEILLNEKLKYGVWGGVDAP